MHEAKTQLSRLVAEVESGGEVVIARHGRPVARLVRFVDEAPPDRGFGALRQHGSVDLTWAAVQAGDSEVSALFDDQR